MVGEDNKNYGEICSTDKKNISRLSAAESKKTPLCYSNVKKLNSESIVCLKFESLEPAPLLQGS